MSAGAITGTVVGVLAAVAVVAVLYAYANNDKRQPPPLNFNEVDDDIVDDTDPSAAKSDGSDKRGLFTGVSSSDSANQGRYWDAKL